MLFRQKLDSIADGFTQPMDGDKSSLIQGAKVVNTLKNLTDLGSNRMASNFLQGVSSYKTPKPAHEWRTKAVIEQYFKSIAQQYFYNRSPARITFWDLTTSSSE